MYPDGGPHVLTAVVANDSWQYDRTSAPGVTEVAARDAGVASLLANVIDGTAMSSGVVVSAPETQMIVAHIEHVVPNVVTKV